jgi:hypothetical protein
LWQFYLVFYAAVDGARGCSQSLEGGKGEAVLLAYPAGIPAGADGATTRVEIPVVEMEQCRLFQAVSSQGGRFQQPLERSLIRDAEFGLDLQGACPPCMCFGGRCS